MKPTPVERDFEWAQILKRITLPALLQIGEIETGALQDVVDFPIFSVVRPAHLGSELLLQVPTQLVSGIQEHTMGD